MLEHLFTQQALFFTVPALLGTGIFLLKLGLMTLAGFGADLDADAPDLDAPTDVDLGSNVEAGESTAAFTLLSVQTIAAFLMGFGWGGLGGLIGFDWSLGASLGIGVAFGAGFVWMETLLMKAVYDLQSSGNVHIDDAVGGEGSVYANVPANGQGRGQVRVVIGDRARIYNAVSEGDAVVTGVRVRIVQANDDHTLTVTAV